MSLSLKRTRKGADAEACARKPQKVGTDGGMPSGWVCTERAGGRYAASGAGRACATRRAGQKWIHRAPCHQSQCKERAAWIAIRDLSPAARPQSKCGTVIWARGPWVAGWVQGRNGQAPPIGDLPQLISAPPAELIKIRIERRVLRHSFSARRPRGLWVSALS